MAENHPVRMITNGGLPILWRSSTNPPPGPRTPPRNSRPYDQGL